MAIKKSTAERKSQRQEGKLKFYKLKVLKGR